MTRAIERIISALQGIDHDPSEFIVHDIVKQAYWPDEPTVPGTIVVLYGRTCSDGRMFDEILVLQLADNAYVEHWWDDKTETFRNWTWICERDGEMRIFVPASDRSQPEA